MRIKCPSCEKVINVPEGAATGKGKCPTCGTKLDLGRMQRPGDLAMGAVLGGCRVEALLGRGGMAVVYRATQLSLNRPVALKVLPQKLASDRQFVERFNREASALARLHHANIVGILDKGVEGDTYYFVMEYVEGESLEYRLEHEGKLSPQETLDLMQGVCAALEYAHQAGIVHRDLKPGNILLAADGMPKLADFGIARIVGGDTSVVAQQLTMAHSFMGSIDYMAPEQRSDAAKADHRADIYALGVMLYQMLTGKLPAGTFKPVSRLVPTVTTAVDRVVRTALAQSPAERYESVARFRAALTSAIAEASRPRPAPARRSSSRTAIVAGVAGAVVVAAAIAGVLLSRRGQQPPTHVEPIPAKTPVQIVEVPTPPKPTPEPDKHPKRVPKTDEGAVVHRVLDPVRQFIAEHPDDFMGQIEKLKPIQNDSNPAVAAAAVKELKVVVDRLNKASDSKMAEMKRQAEGLVAKRQFVAAAKVFDAFPPGLHTTEVKKQIEDYRKALRDRARAGFAADKARAPELIKGDKAADAVALFKDADYGESDLGKEAAAELDKAEKALAAETERLAREQGTARAELTQELKKHWGERDYAQAAEKAKAALDKAPTDAARAALQPHMAAAALLADFWKGVLDGAKASVKAAVPSGGAILAVTDDLIKIEREPGKGAVGEPIKSLGPADLIALAGAGLDPKKPDTHLMYGLFYAYDRYDRKANPALAKKAFDQALAAGASPKLVTALQGLNAEAKVEEPQETKDAGYALSLDGTTGFVTIPCKRVPGMGKFSPLELTTFTVEAWVWHRPGGYEEQVVVAKNLGFSRAPTYAIYLNKGYWAYATAFADEKDYRVTREPIAEGQWVHCALVCDEKSERSLYINGKLVGGRSKINRIFNDDKPLTIGARMDDDNNPCAFWNGAIDEVRISGGARYRADFAPERRLAAEPKTVLLLHFDEGKGNVATDATKYKNSGRIAGAGASFVRPDDLKLDEQPQPPPPTPPPPKAPPPGKK